MASTVINDPDALKKYRLEINERINDLKTQLTNTERAIEQCNAEGWKDFKFKEFQQNFEPEKEDIKKLCDALYNYYDNILAQLENKLRGYTDEQSFSLSR